MPLSQLVSSGIVIRYSLPTSTVMVLVWSAGGGKQVQKSERCQSECLGVVNFLMPYRPRIGPKTASSSAGGRPLRRYCYCSAKERADVTCANSISKWEQVPIISRKGCMPVWACPSTHCNRAGVHRLRPNQSSQLTLGVAPLACQSIVGRRLHSIDPIIENSTSATVAAFTTGTGITVVALIEALTIVDVD